MDKMNKKKTSGTCLSSSHNPAFVDKMDEIVDSINGAVPPSAITALEDRMNDGVLLGYLTRETKAGDEGINCSGEFHVGSVGNGKESVFGEGDSHTEGMVVFYNCG